MTMRVRDAIRCLAGQETEAEEKRRSERDWALRKVTNMRTVLRDVSGTLREAASANHEQYDES